jgi:hypothetical protein
LTAIVAREDFSDTIEVRARLYPNQTWSRKCDLFINGVREIDDFGDPDEKIQFYRSNNEFIT